MLGLVKKIFGDSNERELKRMWKAVEYINSLEPQFEVLTDDQLRNKTVEFRERLEKGEDLDDLFAGGIRYGTGSGQARARQAPL